MTEPDLLSGPAPRVFTLPAAAGFLPSLAQGLIAALPEPEALSRALVLLPTRRAGRALTEAFAAADGEGARLLPRIRPLGDVDADDPPFEPGELALAAPPAVSPARRRFELAQLILAREGAAGRSMGPAGALALAEDLARVIDDFASEETADLARLDEAIRTHLPEHLQEAAAFLEIVAEAWPARLKELGASDPAGRRTQLLNALAERWSAEPPETPVIAAGSTGSILAVARLLALIANLPQGAVVLPGFQRDMDARAWERIDDGHPQRAMKALLARMDLPREAVRALPGVKETTGASARRRVVAEALRPAEATGDWLSRVAGLRAGWGVNVFEAAFDGLSLVEAQTPAEEARACALMARETLERPSARVMIVTPDRALAQRILAELRRFDIAANDSAGQALTATPPGAFLARILEAALDPGSALALSALVAAPLFAMGEARAAIAARWRALERAALRGVRPGERFEDIRLRIDKAKDAAPKAHARALIDGIEAGLDTLMTGPPRRSLSAWARALAEAAEFFAATEVKSGAQRLWAGQAGEAAAGLLSDMITESEALDPLTGEGFRQVLEDLSAGVRVRPRSGLHSRVSVLGPLEARLLTADRVIVCGLNEGVWPAAARLDPFLSRGMRAKAGLAAPERRFGLSAHDFAELAGQGEAVLTRAQTDGRAPTVASRWVWRLKTLAKAALGEGAASALAPPTDYLGLTRALDKAKRTDPIAPPAPKPPLSARPRRLSVTRIETWVRDPYAIYARFILGLEPLDPLDRPPGPAERGTAYHDALETFLRDIGEAEGLPLDAEARLIAQGRQTLRAAGFSEADLGAELPRFRRAITGFLAEEAARRSAGARPIALEVNGALELTGPGGPFTLTARADRIDMRADGGLDIIDYKTGTPPSNKTVAAGFAPQLPLEAAMAARGGLPGVTAHEPGALFYVHLSASAETSASFQQVLKDDDPIALAETALERFSRWIARFDDPNQDYPSQPRRRFLNAYGDYDHLARRAEWDAVPDPSAERS